jgi:hypothetical protein
MAVRSLSRAVKSTIAAGALALAVPGAALAMPAQPDPGTPVGPVSGNVTAGTDVAAPDQQSPIPAEPKQVPQQAPTWPANPQVLTPPSSSVASADAGFQWDDAGIGAGGALVVVLAGFGGALAIRRRHMADPPLPA